jgi:hypothetical protein
MGGKMGYVYVLTNPSMPGLVKIGSTDRPLGERITELSGATGVPTPFTVECFIPTNDYIRLEQELHTSLSKYRVREDREFFRVQDEEAKRCIRNFLRDAMAADLLKLDDEQLGELLEHILSERPALRRTPQEVSAVYLLKLDDDPLVQVLQFIIRKRPNAWRMVKEIGTDALGNNDVSGGAGT